MLVQLLLLPGIAANLASFNLTTQRCKRYSSSNRPSQDCSGQDLVRPPYLFSDVVALNLAKNPLHYIDSFPSTYSDLQSIRFDSCQIEKIDMKAIAMLTHVKHLDFAHNRISHIIFSPRNRALTTLNLSYNKLRYIPDFSSLTSLRLLDLTHNELVAVVPRLLPFNVESLRFTANALTHLTPWPHLTKLQELDVSLNPLACECPLWRFVNWAESLSLFDSTTLPCLKPATLRRDTVGELICGPEINGASTVERRRVSLGESQQLCCVVASAPDSLVYWTHILTNISQTTSERVLSDSGQVKYCITITPQLPSDLGSYKCIAELNGKSQWKEFLIERHRSPMAFQTGEHLLFYALVTMCIFITVFFCASFCLMRRNGKGRKTSPDKDFYYSQIQAPIIHTMESDGNTVRVTPTYEEWNKAQLEIWRQRMASIRAPLAEFDHDTPLMPIIHTAV